MKRAKYYRSEEAIDSIYCFCANCYERITESEEIGPDTWEISWSNANGRMPGCKKCRPEDYKARCIRRDKEQSNDQ